MVGCQSLQPGARCEVLHAVSISLACKEIPRAEEVQRLTQGCTAVGGSKPTLT